MTYKEFLDYYSKYKKTPGMIAIPKHILNEKELLSRYQKYIKPKKIKEVKSKKKTVKGTYDDPLWKDIVDKVRKRDYNICRLQKILNEEELFYLKKNYPYYLLEILDPAHVIPRSKSKALYYELNNIYLINRISHSFLDSYRHPVLGTPITLEERNNWWIRIIGKETYDKLETMK